MPENAAHIQEQGRPKLPTNGLLGVPKGITNLKRLLDLLEEHFDRSATAATEHIKAAIIC
jgi:hypothetical protein